MADIPVPFAEDIVRGAPKIAAFIGQSARAVYHQLENGQVPGAFKMANRWCLRKSTYERHIAALERGDASELVGA